MAKLEIINDREMAKDIIEKYISKRSKEYREKDTDRARYPMELFGIECGEGWYGIIAPLIGYVEEYNENHPDGEPIEILQIKEKFGELRFYTNFTTPELNELIIEAEEKSWKTCETCGSTENVGHTMGWISVLCPECIRRSFEKNPCQEIRWSDRGRNNEVAVIHEINSKNIDKFMELFEK